MNNIDEIINKILWWIPFRKKRDFLRNELKESINKIIENKDKIISDKNKVIEDKDKIISDKNKAIENKDKIISDKNRVIEDKNRAIEDRKRVIEDKNRAIEDKNRAIEDKNRAIEDRKRVIEDKNRVIEDRKRVIEDKNKIISDKNKTIEDKDKIISDKNKAIEDKNKTIENNKKIINNLPAIVLNRTVELFSIEKDLNKQKEILEKNLYLIEIEIASYCNRTCWFCPNSIVDRHTNNIELEEELYLKIINDLKEINYSNKVSFHRFNEPLANRELILKRVKQAREALPYADLQIFTNGDYLNRDYLYELRKAGINTIIMSYYSKENNQFDVENIIKPAMEKRAKKLGLEYNILFYNNKEYTIKFDYYDLYFIYKARNFEEIGSDRGGSINSSHIRKENIRDYGCFFPITDLYIDYNGLVMPCCNMRSDLEIHKPYILGDIHDNNLFEIFTSEKFVNMRKYLYSDTVKHGPCEHCIFNTDSRLKMLTNSK
ncbi:SPASM domain-containing protein [uncultured Brachyspira sp.]|uniref:SPASM domain-containing protein n=1 Tax=uncultured Brachyspira sp. TaxID=221953 RepID=UPI00260BC389|nr:SPASM domain-containing protein [uncultured Brachyspira sp.]